MESKYSKTLDEILAKYWLDATSSQNKQPYIAANVEAKAKLTDLLRRVEAEARKAELAVMEKAVTTSQPEFKGIRVIFNNRRKELEQGGSDE